MPDTNQVRADFSVIEQASADLTTHAGTLEEFGTQIHNEASNVLEQLAGGVGTEAHTNCMQYVDGLIQEHLTNLAQYRSGTDLMNDDYTQGAHDAVQRLSRDGRWV